MTLGVKRHRMGNGSRRRGGYLFSLSLSLLAISGIAAYWAVTTLFTAELRQTGQWIEAKFESLRK